MPLLYESTPLAESQGLLMTNGHAQQTPASLKIDQGKVKKYFFF